MSTAGREPDGGTSPGPPLELVLLAPPGEHRVGVPLPVGLRLRNRSPEPVAVVGVLDGSEEGVRYPWFRPWVVEGGVSRPAPVGEDPMVPALRTGDVAVLAPGEEIDPTAAAPGRGWMPLATLAGLVPLRPGPLEIGVTFSTESPREEAWLGRWGQEPGSDGDPDAVRELLRTVPRLTIRTEPLRLEALP